MITNSLSLSFGFCKIEFDYLCRFMYAVLKEWELVWVDL